MSSPIGLIGLEGIGEIQPGDDLAAVIADAATDDHLTDADVVVVTQKIVSKAEGRLVDLATVRARPHQLERDLLLELTVRSIGQEHAAHAAVTDLAD